MNRTFKSDETLSFYIQKHKSFDPLEHDFTVHHITQRAVTGTLVSLYKPGTVVGTLAEKWDKADDGKSWTFVLRKGLQFSDGTPIDASAVKYSLTRLALKVKERNSRPGLIEHIVGFESLSSLADSFQGIQVLNDLKLKIECKEPVKNFLEKISFGLYGIVSSADFDKKVTGKIHQK